MPFSERTQKDVSGALKCFPYTVTNVLLLSAKNTKNETLLNILITATPGINMITRKMTPFSHLLLKFYQFVFFIFAFKDLQNSIPPLNFVLFCKIHMPRMSLSSLLKWISFLRIKFAYLWYII